ncbi:ribosome biogenesis GTP-binding protein YihA/YsxC [Methylocella sp.]|uniref:ribosome biogenesis GTP-binding protein YihA/YsxC n=1 Tax=Methylocella sp. TaxID=1978226 RepID=UPI0037831A3C
MIDAHASPLPGPSPDEGGFLEAGRRLFAEPCDFLWAASSVPSLPPTAGPEIAFAGRSNVGKSSLLNALTGRKSLARTSHTPGRTRELNFFGLGGDVKQAKLRLVDMPGYGYAAAPKEQIAQWTRLTQDFLRGRAPLLRCFVLVDGRHGLKPPDEEMMDLLDRCALSYQLVLTKRDEVKDAEAERRVAETLERIARRPAAFPQIVFTSSRSAEGVAELRGAIARLLAEQTV